MNIIQIKPDLVRKGLAMYTIPTKRESLRLIRVEINDEVVQDYEDQELNVGNAKIVLCNYVDDIDAIYDR